MNSLEPPNQGSEVVYKLGSWKLFYTLNRQAGLQLGAGKNRRQALYFIQQGAFAL